MSPHHVGDVSPEGKRRWDGVQWVPFDPDGKLRWTGQNWVPIDGDDERVEKPEPIHLSIHHDEAQNHGPLKQGFWTRPVNPYSMEGGAGIVAEFDAARAASRSRLPVPIRLAVTALILFAVPIAYWMILSGRF